MADRYWVGGSATWDNTAGSKWATASGGAGGASLTAGDNLFFDANSGSVTVTCGSLARAGTLNFTGFTGTLALGGAGFEYRGTVTLVSGMTVTPGTAGAAVLFNRIGTASVDFTTAGKDLGAVDFQVTNSGTPGTVTLQGALTCTGGSISVNGGTLTTNNNAMTAASLSAASGDTLNLGSSLVTLNGTGTVWKVNAGATVNAGTSTIKLTNSSASGKTFASGGKTYATVWFAPGSGTGTFTITGAATIGELKDDGTAAHTVVLPASATTTVTTFNINGTSGQRISLRSSSAGTQATLSKASSTVNTTFLDIKDIAATGGATFNATFSINSGNNSGWNITQPATMTQAIIIA